MTITLNSNLLTAQIETKGAELVSLKNNEGTEYMWQKDAKYWNRCSPILFPIVGNLRDNKTIIEGKEYTIPKHGFCRDADFKIVSQTQTTVTLNYIFNEETLAVYPYKFSLSLSYTLTDNNIEISYKVENIDDKPIDYCLGAHPAFNVPINCEGTFEDYCLEFNKKETYGCPIYDLNNLQVNIDNRINFVDENNRIMLKNSLFDEDAIMFDKINSDSVKLINTNSKHGVQVDYKGFDFIAFWTPTKMNAPFLCIEPWNGIAVCSDEDNQFINKRGVKHLNIGENHSYSLLISLI